MITLTIERYHVIKCPLRTITFWSLVSVCADAFDAHRFVSITSRTGTSAFCFRIIREREGGLNTKLSNLC